MATKNTETFMQWIDAHRAHDFDRLVTFLAEDATIQSAAGADVPPAKGKEQARHQWQAMYSTFPDFRMDAVALTSYGDTLFAEISHGGTMHGPRRPTGAAIGPRAPSGSTSPTARSAQSGPIGTAVPWPSKWASSADGRRQRLQPIPVGPHHFFLQRSQSGTEPDDQ